METDQSGPQGLFLPLITPFRDGALDESSFTRLVQHYTAEPIDALILGATTGEGLTLDESEVETLVSLAVRGVDQKGREMPLYLGVSGSDTRKVIEALERTATWPLAGYLISCPYYTRPSQEGLYAHYSALADATAHPILIYNIPYRTGVNLGNETMLRLATHQNIAGLKDCCANPAQTFELLQDRPAGFSVLMGEDPQYYAALTSGADGGILASAHVRTRNFADVRNQLIAGDLAGALSGWRLLSDLPGLLFAEPSPAAIKHWLWRTGLIESPEVRLPMLPASDALAARIDREVDRLKVLVDA